MTVAARVAAVIRELFGQGRRGVARLTWRVEVAETMRPMGRAHEIITAEFL
jgi:hypothetical protein